MAPKPTEFLSVAEAARILDVTVQSVYEWLKDGTLSCVKAGKRATLIQRVDVEKLRSARAVKS